MVAALQRQAERTTSLHSVASCQSRSRRLPRRGPRPSHCGGPSQDVPEPGRWTIRLARAVWQTETSRRSRTPGTKPQGAGLPDRKRPFGQAAARTHRTTVRRWSQRARSDARKTHPPAPLRSSLRLKYRAHNHTVASSLISLRNECFGPKTRAARGDLGQPKQTRDPTSLASQISNLPATSTACERIPAYFTLYPADGLMRLWEGLPEFYLLPADCRRRWRTKGTTL